MSYAYNIINLKTNNGFDIKRYRVHDFNLYRFYNLFSILSFKKASIFIRFLFVFYTNLVKKTTCG